MTPLLLAAALGAAIGCTTPDPGAGFTCVKGQWLSPGHPLLREVTPVTVALPGFEPSETACQGLNPYHPDRALLCAIWDRARRPSPTQQVFEVGATYRNPYGMLMIVLSIGTTIEGIPVVTGQLTSGAQIGQVFAFRTDQQPSPWEKR